MDERALLVRRLDEFIYWSLVAALAAVPGLLLLAILFQRPMINAFSVLALGQAGVLLWARGQAQKEHFAGAVTGIGVGMWAIAATMAFLVPEIYPFIPLLGIWPVIVALPYIGGRFLLRFIILSAVIETAMAALSLRAQPFPLGLPLWILHLAAAVVVPPLTTLISIVLWQYSSRLSETLAGLRTANAALKESERLLESRVVARTAELAAANAEIGALNERLKVENVRLGAELAVTRRLQQMVLPRPAELEQTPGLEIATHMQPATEVGGDYYDVLLYADGRTKIGIGDVTGHGLESGVLMLMVQMGVRTLLAAGERSPKRFLEILNRALWQNVARMGTDKNLSLALLDYHDGRLCLSGQHETVLVARASGEVENIDTVDLGFPVGLIEDISPFVAHADLTLVLGDVVVLYSDGIVEAENLDRVQYGLGRLRELVHQHRTLSATEIKDLILRDLLGFVGAQEIYDDITVIVLKQR